MTLEEDRARLLLLNLEIENHNHEIERVYSDREELIRERNLISARVTRHEFEESKICLEDTK